MKILVLVAVTLVDPVPSLYPFPSLLPFQAQTVRTVINAKLIIREEGVGGRRCSFPEANWAVFLQQIEGSAPQGKKRGKGCFGGVIWKTGCQDCLEDDNLLLPDSLQS